MSWKELWNTSYWYVWIYFLFISSSWKWKKSFQIFMTNSSLNDFPPKFWIQFEYGIFYLIWCFHIISGTDAKWRIVLERFFLLLLFIIIIIFSGSNSGLNNPITYSIYITISAYPILLLLLNLLINWCERNWRNVSILKGSWWGGGEKVTYWGLLS